VKVQDKYDVISTPTSFFPLRFTMQPQNLVSLLIALLLGVALAFIRPALPTQIGGAKPTFVGGLDNPAIVADGNIHPARKCE
jgi:hypothetical protein